MVNTSVWNIQRNVCEKLYVYYIKCKEIRIAWTFSIIYEWVEINRKERLYRYKKIYDVYLLYWLYSSFFIVAQECDYSMVVVYI
jgi:hypothetical protein